MAHTTLLPYSAINHAQTPRRRHWRRHPTTMIIHGNPKLPLSPLVHSSSLPLPDVVNDCQSQLHRRALHIDADHHQTQLTCKQIAHSLRLVADQVDQKYCQDKSFHHHLHYLSIRLIFQTSHLRTILYTLWTRSFVPLILLICKTRSFL